MVSDVTLQTAIDQQSQTSLASAGLADDFSQFLQLLTVQLQHQDPLSPMDTTEFTNQIVAFTGVEQQINTNQKLDSLVALNLSNSMSSAQNYVGQEVSYISSEFNFDGSPSNLRYSLPENATDTTLRILNEDGRVVYEEKVSGGAGAHDFVWNGQLTGGGVAADGTYEISIDALNANGDSVQATSVVKGLVRGVESQGGEILLLVGERAVALGNVLNTSVTKNDDVSNSITSALSYIGLDITYNNDEIVLRNGETSTVNYTLSDTAERAKILIYNDQDELVFSDDINRGAGSHSYEWDGNGLPAGEYRYEIDAIEQGKTSIKSSDIEYNGTDDPGITYTLQTASDSVEIKVYDDSGALVDTDTADNASGAHTYTWRPDGSIVAGDYRIEVTAIDETDTRVPVSSTTVGRVTGVEADNGVIFLQTGPTTFIPLVDILAVSVPDETEGA